MDSSVPLMHHDPSNLGSISDPDPDHPKGTHRSLDGTHFEIANPVFLNSSGLTEERIRKAP